MGDVLAGLGMAGVQVAAAKVYETVANGVADGTFFPGDTIAILRLTEVLPYTYRVPGGFYRGSFSIIVSEDFVDSVGEEDAAAIRAALGEDFSAFAGKAWDEGNERGVKAQTETGKVIDLEGTPLPSSKPWCPRSGNRCWPKLRPRVLMPIRHLPSSKRPWPNMAASK